ncbi:MAG TPA: hypothetical protein VMS09_13540 [Paenibacillus sp.]|nr:hypothetical protein [Paenibacillus sp.]HUC93024.1 hypothetical protein [Paenibacillus sp.]
MTSGTASANDSEPGCSLQKEDTGMDAFDAYDIFELLDVMDLLSA